MDLEAKSFEFLQRQQTHTTNTPKLTNTTHTTQASTALAPQPPSDAMLARRRLLSLSGHLSRGRSPLSSSSSAPSGGRRIDLGGGIHIVKRQPKNPELVPKGYLGDLSRISEVRLGKEIKEESMEGKEEAAAEAPNSLDTMRASLPPSLSSPFSLSPLLFPLLDNRKHSPISDGWHKKTFWDKTFFCSVGLGPCVVGLL